jgi:hypothetical protein
VAACPAHEFLQLLEYAIGNEFLLRPGRGHFAQKLPRFFGERRFALAC